MSKVSRIMDNHGLHLEVMKNVNSNIPPDSSGNQQKELVRRKALEKEELVKYMSSLPSYLEKGENFKEKAFSVGVLDWRQLRKWQNDHRPMCNQSSRCSPSSSNTSFFSTDGSSTTHSSRGHSVSPTSQRMQRPTLQSHLNITPEENHPQGVETLVKHVSTFQDLSSNPLKERQNIFRKYQSFSKNQSDHKLKEHTKRDIKSQVILEKVYGTASQRKGKSKVEDGESSSEFEDLKEPDCDVHRNDPRNAHCTLSCPFDIETTDGWRSEAAGRRRFSEGFSPKDAHDANSYSNILSEPSSSRSVRISVSSSRDKNTDQKKSKIKPMSNPERGQAELSGSRKPSPTRRLMASLGMIGRNSISKDSSENVTAEAIASSRMEDSSNRKPNGTRSHSSPLRRLLEPLLKPKAANFHQFPESSEKDSERACKSSSGQVKVKLDLKNCKTIDIDDSHHNKKRGSSVLQALLQITIKNGLPLFTFAVDNNSDVLAATMRKASASRKDEPSWVYTFFCVHEVKKKNGLINKRAASKSRGYVPDVIAQMMVSDSVLEHGIKEFVLSAVDLRHSDPDFQKNDELAAIVVKIPEEICGNLNKVEHQSEYLNPSMIGLEGNDNVSSVCSQDHRVTVILPGASHGLPSKGEPSPLIMRWKSGGACDCGGWDVGCRLRVFRNQTDKISETRSSQSHHPTAKFELFSQGEIVDDRAIFSLSQFKDGIYSVDFNSSVSYLQAFSICIAVLNSRKACGLSELSNLLEKSCEEVSSVACEGSKPPPDSIHMEIPASYATYPPLSPAGRV